MARVQFACSACGGISPKWEGRCPACAEWNTLVEEVERPPHRRQSVASPAVAVTAMDAVAGAEAERRPSGIGELDRVLGGGVVGGSLILLGGDPGIGKSTLALQLAHCHASAALTPTVGAAMPDARQGAPPLVDPMADARQGAPAGVALYCAGEESAAQLGMRARRLGCASATVSVLTETDLDTVVATITAVRPAIAVVDSIQTVHDDGVPGSPGSPTQVREAVSRLLACAKSTGVPIVLVGHVTKEGAIAGPRTLEHMVDVVLYLEGDRHGEVRLLRGIKNRFGSTGELGLFALTEGGMIEVSAPGRAFLDEASLGVSGSALTVTCEGSRALVVEVQALTTASAFTQPRRTASGFDLGRLHLLLAVLEKRAGLSFAKHDAYVNAVGGVRLSEPAVDLAVALAIAGSARNRTLPKGIVILGEVGLAGEIRRVRRLESRLAEAGALGMAEAIIPAGHHAALPPGMTCRRFATLREAVGILG
ncbi:MAG: DNA repair protein RadA [Candidatus Dormibacteria bacterium]